MLKKYFTLPATFSLLLVSGCAPDPADNGSVPASHISTWEPWCDHPPPPLITTFTYPVVPCPEQQLTVADLFNIALLNNPDTRGAWYRARAAAFGVREASASYYPQIDAKETLGVARQSLGDLISESGYSPFLISDLQLTYLLLDFGVREGTRHAACAVLEAADWTHQQAIQNVMLAVIQPFYDYLGFTAAIEAKKEDIKNAETSTKAAELLYRAGIKIKTDYLLAKSELVKQQLDLERLQGQQQVALGKLATAMGLPANTPFQIAALPTEIPIQEVSEDMDILVATARGQRPDLASAAADIRARYADIETRIGEGLPTLTGVVDLTATRYIGTTLVSTHTYTGAIELQIPIFHGFLHYNRTKKAEELLKASYTDYEKKEAAIILDVWTSYYSFQTAKKTLTYSEEYLKYSEEAYASTSANYKYGTGTIIDLLASQSTLANARLQRIQAKTQWLGSISSIAYATGTLGFPCEDEKTIKVEYKEKEVL